MRVPRRSGSGDPTPSDSEPTGRPTSDPTPTDPLDLLAVIEPADGPDGGSDAPRRRSRFAALAAVVSRNRVLWIVAAAALLSLVAGLLVGRFVVSPAEAAANAEPPAPGLITAPVDFGELSNDVTLRGEVRYADAVEVTIDTTGIQGAAVVTGQVPAAGTELSPLSIALEIAGRPVIVLPGDLPAYRTLRFGVSGPDVVQFKTALRGLGIDAGDPADDVFDETAANAVTELYAQAGYAAPATQEGGEDVVRAAQETLRAAEQGLVAAQKELDAARAGSSPVEVREADNAVASARRELEAARAAEPPDGLRIADLDDALGLAELRRAQLGASTDTGAQRGAVESAQSQVTQAQEDLTRARQSVLPALPAGEVLFLTSLPRRVDAVTAKRGGVLSGAAMTVSGAQVELSGSAAEADARLLSVGQKASFELPDRSSHGATVSGVDPAKDGKGRWTVTLTPDPLSPEQIEQLRDTNVKVRVAVGATEGAVLSVPVAALSAGSGGESRVEVVDGDPRDPSAATRLVVVTTGLAAKGAVEVSPVDGTLDEGDLVVVGR
ncbi:MULTISPECIES: hypothetical protein [unclassified Rathayibacter]|uniref:hypothetical protein n=1 Tax=unclassified Rathayibacter TaxID=2609250 RepID=UPI001FB2CA1D|nr:MULTISPECIES: hypothetical protein [unclassified Rathayibacter]MCJ1674125.1 hypothetical protein [Rathayibacter sp. VKM Ac-2929]MCJ1684406.1 hypothetical protein [Rathayibacter sp. VKM Ac-2928]